MKSTRSLALSVVLSAAVLVLQFPLGASAEVSNSPALTAGSDVDSSETSELDPFAADVQQNLQQFDRAYETETGNSPFTETDWAATNGCRRETCAVWVRVEKSTQTLHLYLNGVLTDPWAVSTGVPGRDTPNFDTHPDGRIYTKLTSNKYPGGDYKGLGNMPYAVFIRGGFALHGTPEASWSKLGRKASHGCIRQLPDNALYFNQLVRQNGIANVWITVED